MRAAKSKPGRIALGAAVAAGVRHMAHRFIAGESPQAAVDELGRLWEAGIASSVDLLGEATVTSAEADLYAARCTEALEVLAEAAAKLSRSIRCSIATRAGRCRGPTSRSRSPR